MSHWPLLSLVTFLPLVGVGFIMTSRGEEAVVARNARNIALSTSVIVFALSILLWVEFDPSTAAFQVVARANWISIGGVTINYHMGIDGISLFFILLATLLTVLCVGASWTNVHSQVREYMIAFLVLETMMVGIFCALDFVLFYVFFECVLIPMFVIIGVWCGTRWLDDAFRVYRSVVALAQTDMQKLIAYLAVAHMGFVTMGLFALTSEAVQGAMVQMLSHGLVSAALFLVVGVVYDRLHARDIDRYGGLVERMPVYAFVFMCFMLASIGLPGTSGFVGEFLILLGTFRVSTLECFLAATALFLGAMYMLYLYRRVIFGTITRDDLRGMTDLSWREKAVFAPLLLLVLWMGVYPSSFLVPIRTSVDHLVAQVNAANKNPRQADAGGGDQVNAVIPAKAGIHPSAVREVDQWIPAFAGTTSK